MTDPPRLIADPSLLFWSPIDADTADWPPLDSGEWRELGTAVAGAFTITPAYPESEPIDLTGPWKFGISGQSISMHLPAKAISGRTWRLLTGRTHPRITAMHRSYTQRWRNRRKRQR
jgi:hypothetical protein